MSNCQIGCFDIVIRSENVNERDLERWLENEFCFSRSHIYIQDIPRNFSWKDFADLHAL